MSARLQPKPLPKCWFPLLHGGSFILFTNYFFFISPRNHFKMIFQMLANQALLSYCPQRSVCLLACDREEQEVSVVSCVLNGTRQHRTERISLRTGGLRMTKTQGSIIELIDKNLSAWRSHFSFREEVSFIYAKICKKQKGK